MFSVVAPDSDGEKMAGLEAALLQELSLSRHRQVLHPVLQEGEFSHFLETLPDISHGVFNSILDFSGVEAEFSKPGQAR